MMNDVEISHALAALAQLVTADAYYQIRDAYIAAEGDPAKMPPWLLRWAEDPDSVPAAALRKTSAPSLVKDAESGRSQAHGEHGHFASGSSENEGTQVYRGVTSAAGRSATLGGLPGTWVGGRTGIIHTTDDYDVAHAYAHGYGAEDITEPHVMSGRLSPDARLAEWSDIPDEVHRNSDEARWLRDNGYDGAVRRAPEGWPDFPGRPINEHMIVNPDVLSWGEEDAVEPKQSAAAPDIVKDKVSGQTQAHGEHGHFASGSSGDDLPGSTLRPITATMDSIMAKYGEDFNNRPYEERMAVNQELGALLGRAVMPYSEVYEPATVPNASPYYQAVYAVESSKGPIVMTVALSATEVPTPEQAQRALSVVADLHEQYGKEGEAHLPVIRVVSPLLAEGAGSGSAAAYVLLPSTMMSMRDNEFNINLVGNRVFSADNVSSDPHWFEPAAQRALEADGDYARALITHEYGHVDHNARTISDRGDMPPLGAVYSEVAQAFEVPHTNVTVYDKYVGEQVDVPAVDGLSNYGHTNPHEAYAELFTEWTLSNGTTDSPAAQAYGRIYGWTTK